MSKIKTTVTIEFLGNLEGYANTVPEMHVIGQAWAEPIQKVIDTLIDKMNQKTGPTYRERCASFSIKTNGSEI